MRKDGLMIMIFCTAYVCQQGVASVKILSNLKEICET